MARTPRQIEDESLALRCRLINQRSFEVIKEINGIELRLAALEGRLVGGVDDPGAPD
jgi:hypothetical protein